MAAKGSSKAETLIRVQRFSRIIANGGRRSDCVRYASENWGVSERTADNYLEQAREALKADWDIERPYRWKPEGLVNITLRLVQLIQQPN